MAPSHSSAPCGTGLIRPFTVKCLP
jgi:hypothetical protein